MKIERSKNAVRNVAFSWILKLYSLLVPFAIRTIMIHTIGMQYLGLNSLFSSVLQVLNLAELGVGSALVFSMYKPIAEDDTVTICALMRLYRKYYRIIGLVILVVGLVITPFVPKLISGTVPDDMNVYVLYLMNLAATVVTYWLFAYKNSLLSAHQRGDVSSKITLVISTIQYALQIAVLFLLKNYYYYVLIIIAFGIIGNIVTAIVVDKMYPEYHAVGNLPKEQIKEINRKVRDLFTAKLGCVVVESADTIVISAFLGLSALAIYQNYFYIVTAISGFIMALYTACTAGIGNSIITETQEKNFNDLKKFTLIISWIAGFCMCCLACLYQPFMQLWVGKENMLDYSYVICFCAYFYIRQINSLLNLYKDAAGIWHKDRFRPLVTAFANLIMNLIMVQFWGLYGVLLSTVLSMLFVGMPWLYTNLFTVLFKFNPVKYIFKTLLYTAISAASCVVCVLISNKFINFESLILTMIVRGVLCCVVPNIIYIVCYRKTAEFKGSLSLVNGITKGKIKFLNKYSQ